MKRIITITICLLLLVLPCLSMTACSTEKSDVITLYVYNWGEYISDGSEDSLDVNQAFEVWYNNNIGSKNGTKVSKPSGFSSLVTV